MENTELTHWGVKGMRWGVRRYQNKDGTLTSAGKKRYDKEMEKLKREERVLKNKQRTQAKFDKLESKRRDIENLKGKTPEKNEPKKKTIKDLSNDELREVVTRLELEKRYNDVSPKTVSVGSAITKKVWNDMIVPAATDVGKQLIKSAFTKMANDGFNLSSDYKVHTNNKKKS